MLEHLHYVMVVVSDMKRSVAFYRDVLGMKLRFESPDWTEFDTGKTTLALHGGGKPGPAAHGPPPAGTASLGLGTLDLEAEVARLKGLGVRFVMEPQERPGEGIKLAVCVDPDGLGISLSQRLG
ncbi:MAG: VOC family protein [Deltaproteobacteria bacterium]|nr:VOC family protein [Deltaproteobacteria bacterium]